MNKLATFLVICSLVFLVICFLPTIATAQKPPESLPASTDIARNIRGSETQRFRVNLSPNELFSVHVTEGSTDIELRVKDQAGITWARILFPAIEGVDTLSFIPKRSGIFVLEVKCLSNESGGSYVFRREPGRQANQTDRDRANVQARYIDALLSQASPSPLARKRSLQSLQNALDSWKRIGDEKMTTFASRRIAILELAQNVSLDQKDLVKFLNMSEEELQKLAGELQWGIESFQKIGAKHYTSYLLDRIAQASAMIGRYDEAEKALEQAIALQTETGDRFGLGASMTIGGAAYVEIRDLEKAEKFLTAALGHFRAVRERSGEALALTNLGNVYLETGNLPAALKNFRAALPLAVATQDDAMRADALNGIAWVLNENKEFKKAIAAYLEVVSIYDKTGVKTEKADALMGIARANRDLGNLDTAVEYYQKALTLFTGGGDRAGQSNVLSKLMYLYDVKRVPALAIMLGKQAINIYQEMRSNIRSFDQQLQKNYVQSVEGAYRKLADILIAEGRLSEAQSVMAMLKDEEVAEYLRRDASELEKLKSRIDLRERERVALARYKELSDKIASIGKEFDGLREAKISGRVLNPEEQSKYSDLSGKLEQANLVFQVFLRSLADEFASRTNVVSDIQENAGLQADLRSWGPGVVSLYTVIGEDRYRVILTTPQTQIDGKTEIKTSDLNRKIDAFRKAVQNPKIDPRPLGKELYDILIKPIDQQLRDSKATTLLWSLDSTLRYVPLAALWDGQQYFGQTYRNVIITLASRSRLSETPTNNWRLLGLGVTGARQLTEPNGTGVLSFSALPAVRTELESIVHDAIDKSGSGVIDGKRLIDSEFTEEALEEQLTRNFRAVHIASHFRFRPGDITRSFLLLGDGSALTMEKIKTSPRLKFPGVELLTLSACDTAVGEPEANGKEVENFAVVAQQNGAKAVIATLWPVADESTALFMADFYRTKSQATEKSKATALQEVQRAMIDGRINSRGLGTGCRAENFGSGPKSAEFKCDPKAPFSHPYFWSPFVLIGNWR